MLKTTGITIALVTAVCSAVGHGEITDSWYADLALGFSFANDMTFDNSTGSRAEFDFGVPAGSLSVGRFVAEKWRFELEASYRFNDLETLYWPSGNEENRIDPNDGVRALSFQLNAIRDFQIGALAPYFGAGVGPAHLRLRISEASIGGTGPEPRRPILDDETWSAAIQLIAGFSVPLSASFDLAFDYRLWHAPSIKVTDAAGEAFDLEHTVHAGYVHLRYLFDGQRPRTPKKIAPPDPGWTLAASIGGSYPLDREDQNSLENFDAFQVGPVYTLVLGYPVTPRWRLELEAARRSNEVQVIDFNPEVGQFSADGKVVATSVIANALYRFRPSHPIRPFVGAGVGATRANYDVATRGEEYVDDSATAPVVQFLAGLDIALTDQLEFVADYRSWYATGIKLTRPDGEELKTSHWVHSLSLGIRYSL